MTDIYVDADACPVKAEVERVATRHKLKVYVVSNGGLRPSVNPLIENVIVPDGPDVADMWIAERAGVGDVVITGDIPLAAKCVEAGAKVLKHNGEALNERNVGQALAVRDLMTDLRSADPFRQGGGKAFSKADRSRFLDALERDIRAAKAAKPLS
ncbi:YaiI/YqxD family protein [Cognatishimia sp. 1_MG-2023]|uniref:YaiI/YqxD family protein n=1 Tax=Cognatishimia sp. 1_MG-2023 TaxID=3062642 RepID=UPI0026E44460|nr:YaiI/YqxD family protein [Cognatishimia sp. 1_MG-2023]MDO6726857.1 YaiI/YqxD family protein [Cognatishimia sp. 1_MG-2023]